MRKRVFLGLFLAAAACSSVPYVETKPLTSHLDEVMLSVERAARHRGYLKGEIKLREEVKGQRRHFHTPWKVSMQPLGSLGELSRGLRWRMEGYIEEREGQYAVGLAVRKEVNMNIDSPLSVEEARWKDDGFDVEEAGILLKKIEYFFKE